MDGSIERLPVRNPELDWWRVFHHSTENLMIGMLTAPTRTRMAQARAARPGSSMVRQSEMTPRYMMKRTSTEVSRASQTHQVPQVGWPQRDPVARQRKVNAAPTGAAAFIETSARGWRHTSAPMAEMNIRPHPPIDSTADGTWMNMILTVAPCW